jgi:hypothetical protein
MFVNLIILGNYTNILTDINATVKLWSDSIMHMHLQYQSRPFSSTIVVCYYNNFDVTNWIEHEKIHMGMS